MNYPNGTWSSARTKGRLLCPLRLSDLCSDCCCAVWNESLVTWNYLLWTSESCEGKRRSHCWKWILIIKYLLWAQRCATQPITCQNTGYSQWGYTLDAFLTVIWKSHWIWSYRINFKEVGKLYYSCLLIIPSLHAFNKYFHPFISPWHKVLPVHPLK